MNIGTLAIELTVGLAGYTLGMSKASVLAQRTSQEISNSFSKIGGVLSGVLGQFGSFGNEIAANLGNLGNIAGVIGGQFHGMGKEFAYAGGAAAAAAGLMVVAGGAAIGVAAHAAEAAAKMYDLSQSTGIAVHELSGLSAVGKIAGVDTETMAKGLERMSKSALAAAIAPNAIQNAYRELGITVTRESLSMEGSTSKLFGEIADKFSTMQDGAAKTALAMQVFGRAGANLIPLLNQGGEAMRYWIDYATKVGAVLGDEDAAKAKVFTQELDKLRLIFEGIENRLMVGLLPALDHITSAFATLAGSGPMLQGFASTVGGALTGLAKFVLDAVETFYMLGDAIAHVKQYMGEFSVSLIPGGNHLQVFKDAMEANKKATEEWDDKLNRVRDTLASMRADLDSKIVLPEAPEAKRQKPAFEGPGEMFPGTQIPIAGYGTIHQSADQKRAQENADEDLIKSNELLDKRLRSIDEAFNKVDTSMILTTGNIKEFDKNLQDENKDLDLATRILEEHMPTLTKYAMFKEQINRLVKEQLINQQQANEVLDDEAKKLGLVADKAKTVADQLEKTFDDAMKKAVDTTASSMTQILLHTGKPGTFKQAAQAMETSVVGGAMKTGLNAIVDMTPLKGLMGGGKPDGTKGNPLHVSLVDTNATAGGNPLTGPLAGMSLPLGGLGKLASLMPFGNMSGAASPSGGFFGGLFKGITSLFGGFRAGGGDVMPGKAYMVGEDRPELFMPNTPGRIVPAGGGGNGPMVSHITMHVHGAKDADSFRDSAQQITTEMYRHMQTQHARNSGSY